ncbi:hypothetical protein AVEN_65486-1, partial [Araneus ventricosus]
AFSFSHSNTRPLPSPISSVNDAPKSPPPTHVPTPTAFMARHTKWSDGYWDRSDIQHTAPHHANSHRFSPLTIGFGVEWS